MFPIMPRSGAAGGASSRAGGQPRTHGSACSRRTETMGLVDGAPRELRCDEEAARWIGRSRSRCWTLRPEIVAVQEIDEPLVLVGGAELPRRSLVGATAAAPGRGDGLTEFGQPPGSRADRRLGLVPVEPGGDVAASPHAMLILGPVPDAVAGLYLLFTALDAPGRPGPRPCRRPREPRPTTRTRTSTPPGRGLPPRQRIRDASAKEAT